MKNIPVLSTSYPNWSWSEARGNASAETVAKAYEAITTEGLCSDFSREVWNNVVGIVADLIDALKAAGNDIDWDDSYSSLADCQINKQYGALTANIFNAVRCNIDNIASTGWKWSYATSDPGFIGRVNFIGVATAGENADILYGWYIEELVRKLNVTIDILKDEANLKNCIGPIKSMTNAPVGIYVGYAPKLVFQDAIRSNTNPILNRPGAAPLTVRNISEFNPDVSLYGGRAGILLFDNPSKSSVAVPFPDLVPTAVLELESKSKTKIFADFGDILYAGRMRYTESALSKAAAELYVSNIYFLTSGVKDFSYTQSTLARGYAKYFNTAEISTSNIGATVTRNPARILNSDIYEKTTLHSKLDNIGVKGLRANPMGATKSKHFAEVSKAYSLVFLSHLQSGTSYPTDIVMVAPKAKRIDPVEILSFTDTLGTIVSFRPQLVESQILDGSISEGTIIQLPPELFSAESLENSTYCAEIDTSMGWLLSSETLETSLQESLLDYRLPELLDSNVFDYSEYAGDVVSLQSFGMSCKDALEMSTHASTLFLASVAPIYSENVSNSISFADIIKVLPIYILVESVSRDISSAQLVLGSIKYLFSEQMVQSHEVSSLDKVESLPLEFGDISNTISTGVINLGFVSSIESTEIGRSSTSATLTFKDVEPAEIWYDPIQTEHNLYIRSAHPQQQIGENVHLELSVTNN